MQAAQLSLALFIATVATVHAADGVQWHRDLENAKRVALETRKPILVHFYSTVCAPCVRLDQEVYARPEVQRALEAMFVPVRLNVDDYPATAETFGVRRWPADVILAPNGQFIAQLNCPQVPAEYLAQLEHALRPGQSPLTSAPPALATNSGSAATAVQAANFTPAEGGIAPSTSAPIGHHSLPARASYAAGSTQPAFGGNHSLGAPAGNVAKYDWRQSEQPPGPAAVTAQHWPARDASPSGHFGQFAAGAPAEARASSTGLPQHSQPASSIVGSAYGPVEQSVPPPTTNAQQQSITGAQQQSMAPAPGGGQAVWGSQIASFPMIPAAEAPPVGLDGFCPVQLSRHRDKWTKGDPRYGVIHRGRTYLFSGPAEQQEFLTNPDRYSPVMGGNDPVLALDQGQQVSGKRKFGRFHGDRVYLFATEESLARFLAAADESRATARPNRYTEAVLQAENPGRGPLR